MALVPQMSRPRPKGGLRTGLAQSWNLADLRARDQSRIFLVPSDMSLYAVASVGIHREGLSDKPSGELWVVYLAYPSLSDPARCPCGEHRQPGALNVP